MPITPVGKSRWWTGVAEESFWCEITDRPDIGADLHCPQADERGAPYWSYALIREIWSGDIVFHYSTVTKAIVGASVAGAPLEDRPIVWVPHGTVGRAKSTDRKQRPGWWLPLYHFTPSEPPLTLRYLQTPIEQGWIQEWAKERRNADGLALPFQMYPGKIRGAQGYLTKMPYDFVKRWPQLAVLVEALGATQEKLSAAAESYLPPALSDSWTSAEFKPKADGDYVAVIKSATQRRSRAHETLVRVAGELLQKAGAVVGNPHPRDLLISAPAQLIIEAKIIGSRHPGFAIREAVGQLLEYRHFLGPRDAHLCILLDGNPGRALNDYVEKVLGFFILWVEGSRLLGGARTAQKSQLQIAEDSEQRRPELATALKKEEP
jgi:hypothetical protein